MSRTAAIRFAAMAIESLTCTDEGSLQAARDASDRLAYELAALAVREARPSPTPFADAVVKALSSSVEG